MLAPIMEHRRKAWYPDFAMNTSSGRFLLCSTVYLLLSTEYGVLAANNLPARLKLAWADDYLTISGDHLPGGSVRVHYLEAYCRDGSTDRAWEETTIGHHTRLIDAPADGRSLKLECKVSDGVIVDHQITTQRIDDATDAVDFHLVATNPTDTASRAHWAQPCIRVDKFTGRTQQAYLSHCFVYVDGRLTRLPTQPWSTKARYTPGQVYCPANVDRNDVNPRPLNSLVPSNGLIGCFSKDEKQILAVAWEPYQELFQGVGVCIHSDFRIGGLKPHETKRIRGMMYFTSAGPESLLKRYESEFPGQTARSPL
jgi:hypothetical protein